MRIRFGECTFDAVRRELMRDGAPAHLSPKAFELLRLLIEQRPRPISKDELFERLWPKTFVTEASLAGLIAEIRREVGDDARAPHHVRTVHGFGYAFADEGASAADEGVFRLVWGTREVPLSEGENEIGREPDCVISIDDATVSRRHARVIISGREAALEDLGSKNGTWLRGRRVAGREPLRDGDPIRIGSVPMVFRCFASGGSTQTQVR
ncbi:MAG: FHA domain-containing protein [Thermoanaerobaculia bacterium]